MQNKYYSYKGKTVSQASQDHHSYTPTFQVTRTPSSPGQHSQNKLPCKIDLTLALDFRKIKDYASSKYDWGGELDVRDFGHVMDSIATPFLRLV